MNNHKAFALLPTLLLAACGGGEEQQVSDPQTPGFVTYSYPADGQDSVSPEADIVLRFSQAITDDAAETKIQLWQGDRSVPLALEAIDGGRSLKLAPQAGLAAGQNYTVRFAEPLIAEGGRSIDTPNASGDATPGIQFSTRALFSGPAALTNTAEPFAIASQVPAEGSRFETMNFSSFRFRMTHPIHPDWQALGGTVTLLDSNGQPVNTTVLVKGKHLTVDPCTTPETVDCGSKADVLDTDQDYTLRITNLPSLTVPGATLSHEITFAPRDTSPTVVLQQNAVDSGLVEGRTSGEAVRSILNGQMINGVTLNSVLLGEAGPSQQTGSLFAELAYAPSFGGEESLPLRIPKGSVLNSTSLDVLVGGIVPVADAATDELQRTGNIKVTLLSDAVGYMSPNAYTDDDSAPRHITLFMDVSMNTEEAQPNAALSQDILGVELRGIALVRDGVLTIDAIGMVEPNLLGQEFTDSTIAFHLEAATDAGSALDAEHLRELDSTAPTLVSWMPGPGNAIPATRQSMHRPGDPVILFFDEPLDPASIAGGLSLTANGAMVDTVHTRLDGTALTINPDGGLQHGTSYEVQINGVTDLAGNVASVSPLGFQLEPTGDDSVDKRPPLALTAYPGFPCETDHDLLDLEAGILGQCRSVGDAGDVMPISTLPMDRPITVVFSKSMDLESIMLGSTFKVEQVTQAADGSVSVEAEVAGRLEKNNQRIRFYPDQPWTPGTHYRYTLASTEEPGTCTAGAYTSICDRDGFALKTDLLEGLDDGEGNNGPDHLEIYFTGGEARQTVFTPLRNLPIRDTNANLAIDCDTLGGEACLEPFAHDGSDAEGFQPSANAAKLLIKPGHRDEARVGCPVEGDNCPRNKFIYQTFALNAEVVGPTIDPDTGKEAIRVLLYPTLLGTTSAEVHIILQEVLPAVSTTGPMALRLRYAKDDPGCSAPDCTRSSLIPGLIVENDDGEAIFRTTAELFLDAPELSANLAGTQLPLEHNLRSYPFTLELEGKVTFFDDGRMQIEQRNSNEPSIDVEAVALDVVNTEIPLFIPTQGIYLNFISNPVKEIPVTE